MRIKVLATVSAATAIAVLVLLVAGIQVKPTSKNEFTQTQEVEFTDSDVEPVNQPTDADTGTRPTSDVSTGNSAANRHVAQAANDVNKTLNEEATHGSKVASEDAKQAAEEERKPKEEYKGFKIYEIPTPPEPHDALVRYNAPSEIPYDEATNYRIAIFLPNEAKSDDFEGVSGKVLEKRIPFAAHIKTFLTGPAEFSAVENQGTPECQTLSPGQIPTWEWAVTPKTARPFKLEVYLWDMGESCANPSAQPRRIKTFDIKVHVSTWQKIQMVAATSNAFLIAAFGLVTAGGGAYAVVRTKRRRANGERR